MKIFRKKHNRKSVSRWLEKALETTIKSAILISYPIIPTVIFSSLWYFLLFKYGLHFSDELTEIAINAWISTFGILYGLLAAVVLNTVWDEYKEIRLSIKNNDFVTFMNLRDEDVSPVIHVMLFFFSFAVLLAFMGLGYPDVISGLFCVGSTTYLFSLVLFVIMEIDNPIAGVWFIKSIPKEWLKTDIKTWRKSRREEFDLAHDEESYPHQDLAD